MIIHASTRPLRSLAAAALLAFLAGCAGPAAPPPPPADGVALRSVGFAELPGWAEDDHAQALVAFRRSCGRPTAKSAGAKLGVGPDDLQAPCQIAAKLNWRDNAGAKAFFESNFKPVSISSFDGKPGLFTGYFEPQIEASPTPGPRFRYPLYRRPAGLESSPATPFLTRSQIEAGGLRNKALEMAWAADAVDLFELQIQGSGRLVMPDKSVVRVGFAGHNGHPYLAIGRILSEYGAGPDDVADWPSMKAWLRANPARAVEVMRRNDRYVFFQELKGDGPIGAQGVALTANRSIAVDPTMISYGLPVWIDTFNPGPRVTVPGPPLRRLMVAQDTGGAIKGVVRGDVFFGAGERAALQAGRMKSPGAWYVLMPNAAAERVVLTSRAD